MYDFGILFALLGVLISILNHKNYGFKCNVSNQSGRNTREKNKGISSTCEKISRTTI